MNINEALRLIAGTMILVSLYLATAFTLNWLWFTAFIGLNLLQSSFTKWCPMMMILKKLERYRVMLNTIPSLVAEIRKSIRCITAQEGISQCAKEDGVLIDVREPTEFSQKSAINTINIPRGILEMKALELYPDAKKPIYIHCATGARSALAAEQLVRLGYENVWAITCKLDDVCKYEQ